MVAVKRCRFFSVMCWSLAACSALGASTAAAQVAPQRTRYELPAANGHGAIIVHLDDVDPAKARRVTHFREHLYATEEPVIDEQGDEVWNGGDFSAVYTRDLLYDAYFGLRDADGQRWLPDLPLDADASGYTSWDGDNLGGSTGDENLRGIVQISNFYIALRNRNLHRFVTRAFSHGILQLICILFCQHQDGISGDAR